MFEPEFAISSDLKSLLVEIDSLKNTISALSITASVLHSLRESSKVQSSHYSTLIEGNELTYDEVSSLLRHGKKFPQKKRDEKEVLGHYAALEKVKDLVESNAPLSENALQHIHGLVMGKGKKKVKVTPYRNGQNAIGDSKIGRIVYMPPIYEDVPGLMADFVQWLIDAEKDGFSPTVSAAIAHYQFATIHPYYDGNGRTSRLFTNWILHRNGYGLKGIYSLEEYYANNLQAYYDAIAVGSSDNYYCGRKEADITPCIEYFCQGMYESFKAVRVHAEKALEKGERDVSDIISNLSKPQHTVLGLFKYSPALTIDDIMSPLKLSKKTARMWVKKWEDEGFIESDKASREERVYRLAQSYRDRL